MKTFTRPLPAILRVLRAFFSKRGQISKRLDPAVKEFSRLLVVEIRNHLVEQVDQPCATFHYVTLTERLSACYTIWHIFTLLFQ